MNKGQLIDTIAEQAGLTKKDSGAALDAVIQTITKALKKNDPVQLVGFGTFKVRKRKARTGINPRTKEKIKIKAAKVPVFSPGKAFKEAIK